MSTASMVEIAETNEVAPLARWGERRMRARAADFDLAIGALSRRLSETDTDDLASVLAPTLEALAPLGAVEFDPRAVALAHDIDEGEAKSASPGVLVIRRCLLEALEHARL